MTKRDLQNQIDALREQIIMANGRIRALEYDFNMPTADVVEVVRCKDCRHYLYSNEKCDLIDTRLNFYATDKIWTNDCFCAWGERREDGSN